MTSFANMAHRTEILIATLRAVGLSLLCASCQAGASDDELGGGSSTTSESSSSASTSESSTSDSSSSETTTSESSSSESSSETGDAWLTSCPSVAAPQVQAMIGFPELAEASGLVHSRTQALLWAHNDSGDVARVFAVSLAGERLATLELAGIVPFDWEALALGPGPVEGDHLYVGDIGDNAKARATIEVHRFAEPADVLAIGSEPLVIDEVDTLVLSYPGGPRDAEAMLVDPLSGELVIVTKGAETEVFRRAAPPSAGELEPLPMPNFPSAFATAADVSARGDFVAIRGYVDAFGWLRAQDQSLAAALQGEPCELPLAAEQQGEALAFDDVGLGYYTLGEGVSQPLWWYGFI